MANLIFESNWHLLPVETQKFYILMIASAQKPLYYHGSHIINLGLETFTKVIVSNYLEFFATFSYIFFYFYHINFSVSKRLLATT